MKQSINAQSIREGFPRVPAMRSIPYHNRIHSNKPTPILSPLDRNALSRGWGTDTLIVLLLLSIIVTRAIRPLTETTTPMQEAALLSRTAAMLESHRARVSAKSSWDLLAALGADAAAAVGGGDGVVGSR